MLLLPLLFALPVADSSLCQSTGGTFIKQYHLYWRSCSFGNNSQLKKRLDWWYSHCNTEQPLGSLYFAELLSSSDTCETLSCLDTCTVTVLRRHLHSDCLQTLAQLLFCVDTCIVTVFRHLHSYCLLQALAKLLFCVDTCTITAFFRQLHSYCVVYTLA